MDAKLVSEDGFAMSICSERIENENGCYDKQDCELKAFCRLAENLKKLFPSARICLPPEGILLPLLLLSTPRQSNHPAIQASIL